MASNDYLVSKFDEAEPLDSGFAGVFGSCFAGRQLRRRRLRSRSSCFQLLSLPTPRLGLRSGQDPKRVLATRRANQVAFVFVQTAKAESQASPLGFEHAGVGVPFFVSEFKGYMLEAAAIALTDFEGHKSESLETDHIGSKSESWFAASEFDGNFNKLESLVAGCEIDQHLVFSEFEGFEGKSVSKEYFRKDTSQKPFEEQSFPSHLQAQLLSELCVETLLFLGCLMVCNLAVLVALQGRGRRFQLG